MYMYNSTQVTCSLSPKSSWQMEQGWAESRLCTDAIFTTFHWPSLSSGGGAGTRPNCCARDRGGGWGSKTRSLSLSLRLPAGFSRSSDLYSLRPTGFRNGFLDRFSRLLPQFWQACCRGGGGWALLGERGLERERESWRER